MTWCSDDGLGGGPKRRWEMMKRKTKEETVADPVLLPHDMISLEQTTYARTLGCACGGGEYRWRTVEVRTRLVRSGSFSVTPNGVLEKWKGEERDERRDE